MLTMETVQAPLYEVEFIPLERRLADRRTLDSRAHYYGNERRRQVDRRAPELTLASRTSFSPV